ncbi:MAG: hypothetical protein Q8L40_09615 [Burkholderiales bacterium]|nr:hypothetical protein [Burkholderiales bacterium]
MQFLKFIQRKFGISAPRVMVRTHVPWYLRWLGLIVVGGLLFGIVVSTYDYGMDFAGFRQREADRSLEKFMEKINSQQNEIAELRSRVTDAERQMQIERATYGDLEKQVKLFANENATLKEVLAFFQSLMPASGRNDAVTINRFRLQQDKLPGEYRYRLLLVQTGQRLKEFQGSLQFILNIEQGDRKAVLTLPLEQDRSAKEYQLNFKFFQRIEGTFKIAPDAVVKGMQVRVFENGSNAPKLTQSVNIS